MSRTNLELARSAYAARFGSEEWSAWVEEFVAPEFELDDRTLPEVSRNLRGPEAAYADAAHMNDSFEDIGYDIEELSELPDGRAFVRVRASARGRASGMRVDGTLGHVWSWSEGRATRPDVYGTWDDAVRAVEPVR